jgi:hypothetical protein
VGCVGTQRREIDPLRLDGLRDLLFALVRDDLEPNVRAIALQGLRHRVEVLGQLGPVRGRRDANHGRRERKEIDRDQSGGAYERDGQVGERIRAQAEHTNIARGHQCRWTPIIPPHNAQPHRGGLIESSFQSDQNA